MRAGWCVVVVTLFGCGDNIEAPPDADGRCGAGGSYLPLVKGASWNYEVEEVGNGLSMKNQTVGDLEDVGGMHLGTQAYRVTTSRPGGTTTSWQAENAGRIVRYAEEDRTGDVYKDEVYIPFKTRVDERVAHLVEGATWDESYTEFAFDGNVVVETQKLETWSVLGVDEILEVPAGAFCTLHLTRTSVINGVFRSHKQYWFARAVGKTREQDFDANGTQMRLESLASYELP